MIVNQHISKTLEVAGYTVFSAYSGKEAFEIASEEEPDLILMDIMMETKDDGIQAAVEIKKELDLPVIFLTALTDNGTLDRVKESEPYGYIVKPFNEVELLSNIKVALHKSKAENAVKQSRDLFQSSINSIDQAFFLIDSDFKIFYLNKSAERILNKAFRDIIGKSAHQALPIMDETGTIISFEDLQALVLSDKPYSLFLKSVNGEVPIGDFQCTQVAVLTDTYTVFTFKDITDRIKARNLEVEMEQKRIASLIEGQENERDRLAREIHDGIGQMINLIKVKVNGLPSSPEKDELGPILEQTLDEIRSVSENLHPSRLKDFSLETNIERLIDQFNSNSSIRFGFLTSDVPKVGHSVKTHLYRIIQEGISNIVKHSQAREAMIQLIGIDDSIQLTIEDDGIGYDPTNQLDNSTHHGLKNIEYRVNTLNGKFTLDSNSENGTMILVTIPI